MLHIGYTDKYPVCCLVVGNYILKTTAIILVFFMHRGNQPYKYVFWCRATEPFLLQLQMSEVKTTV